ncbi:hypothetical protein BGZ58_000481 [Dissophora ornata]|nr:hypothetical protein BGZ58_000481 [Dissophora ornata]
MSDTWKGFIKPKRAGAEFFLGQTGELRYDPREYARFRNGTRRQQERIITEWSSWMRDFRESNFKVLRDAARDVPMLKREDVKFYREESVEVKQILQEKNKHDPTVKNRQFVKTWRHQQHPYRKIPPENEDRKLLMANAPRSMRTTILRNTASSNRIR